MERGPWEKWRTQLRSQWGSRHLFSLCKTDKITQITQCNLIMKWRKPLLVSSTIYISSIRRHTKCSYTTSKHLFIIYNTGSNIKLDWKAQVVHASFMRSPVIHCWKPRLTNHARLHTLTARSLPDRSVATEADNIVFLRPNFLSLSAHSGWTTSCSPVLQATFFARYPLSYMFVKAMYKPPIKSFSA